jgi:hypothetical protein
VFFVFLDVYLKQRLPILPPYFGKTWSWGNKIIPIKGIIAFATAKTSGMVEQAGRGNTFEEF